MQPECNCQIEYALILFDFTVYSKHFVKMNFNELSKCLPRSFTSKHFKSSKRYHMNDDEFVEISRLFDKKFTFTFEDETWCLPETELMFKEGIWKITELQGIKAELNAVKSKLNDFDLEDWHRHTNGMSKAGDILWKLKKEVEPEFVTQAWCKFYETVMSFQLVPEKINELQYFNSFHLCEAPGAFITSLNHFLKLHHPDIKWNWRATTLNPYYEGNPLSSMINDDRFIFQTLPHWIFGCDYTGNIMNLDNVNHLIKEAKRMDNIHLVTADGSIDCQDNPAEQECVVSSLQYYETIVALDILEEGGSYLLKLFTTHEAQTVCLLYLLSCVFHEVSLFKPVTSKEGNSEMYVVCLKYKGRNLIIPWLNKLRDSCVPENEKKVMFPLENIPEDFIKQLIICAKMFKDFQVEVIENNIQKYEVLPDDFDIKRMKYLTAKYFVKHYRLERLTDESKEIVGKAKLKETISINLERHARKGSFNDKLKRKYLDSKEKFLALHEELLHWNTTWRTKSDIKWLKMWCPLVEFSVITGKPINTLYSSKFCSKHLLKIWYEFQEAVANLSESNCTNKYVIAEKQRRCNLEKITDILNENDTYLSTNLKIVNMKTDYWCSLNDGTNEVTEKAAFSEIIDTVCNMQKGENLLISGYPLLTQFNVGVIYLLTSLFQKIGFINPFKDWYSIIFVMYHTPDNSVLKFLKDVREMCIKYEKEEKKISVLAVVSISKLCGKGVDMNSIEHYSNEPQRKHLRKEEEIGEIEDSLTFSQCITEMNNILVKERMCELISNFLPGK